MWKCECGGEKRISQHGSGTASIITLKCDKCGIDEYLGSLEEVVGNYILCRDEIDPVLVSVSRLLTEAEELLGGK